MDERRQRVRHAVFFARFFDEVVGLRGGLSNTVGELRQRVIGNFNDIFTGDLVDATEAVRVDPHDYGKWVEAITVYHLIVEGMLALTGQKFILATIRELGVLPGFYRGFTAVARDESRHVNFGVRALMEAGLREPDLLERVRQVVFRLLEPACRVVASPETKYAIRPEETPPNLQVDPYEVRAFSLNSLTKRLRVAGVGGEVCNAVVERGIAYFDAAWTEYEELHGEPHPSKYYQQRQATPR